MRDTERGRDIGRGRTREPDAGLNPKTPGSCPGWKASAKPQSHPGIPYSPNFLKNFLEVFHNSYEKKLNFHGF